MGNEALFMEQMILIGATGRNRGKTQGNVIYFSKAGIYQNIEEFLTTKARQGAEGRNKALLHASFVRLICLCG
jgi:hypothetical protein